ncbi:MAG: ribosome hibernation-promoting factor, HPF/YfiA family [Christensenellales bacterium]|jgi:putative sigma-54 modulation protein|nr:ribosome-associated translation inhibitor RaiA [Clostridiales bacterium]
MKTNITAKNMVVTPAITNRIVRKTETMSRYLKPDTEMFVRLEKKKNRRVVEITVPLQGVTLRAEATSDDNLFMGIDKALAKLEKQILKHRTKLARRLREDANVTEIPEFIETLGEEEKAERKVVRNKTYTVRPMSLEDAILQMEMLGHTFFVYIDMDTERTHVLYLRHDGQLGLLEPEV